MHQQGRPTSHGRGECAVRRPRTVAEWRPLGESGPPRAIASACAARATTRPPRPRPTDGHAPEHGLGGASGTCDVPARVDTRTRAVFEAIGRTEGRGVEGHASPTQQGFTPGGFPGFATTPHAIPRSCKSGAGIKPSRPSVVPVASTEGGADAEGQQVKRPGEGGRDTGRGDAASESATIPPAHFPAGHGFAAESLYEPRRRPTEEDFA